MNRLLCISVTFLDPYFHGKGDADEPEWPPSPMRLFQALLAGARTGCRNAQWTEATAGAFRWLEQCEPPLIIAPEAEPSLGYTFFVPNNDSDVVAERQERLTSKLARPHRIVGDRGETVHYAWPIADENGRGAASLLCDQARHLLALGWGIDQVVGQGRILTKAEVAALPGRQWRPWRHPRPGQAVWRVPMPGSLDDLEQSYNSFLRRIEGLRYNPPRKPSRFNTVLYLTSTTLPPRFYAAFELPEDVSFPQEKANAVAAMLRSLACRLAKADSHRFPGDAETYVAGHVREKNGDTPPRFSYLPLPTIGHAHADGRIRRLLIAEPYGSDGSHAEWARRRLVNQPLRDHDGHEPGILFDLWRPSSKRVVGHYVDEGKEWCSVTPVILPGFDDGKQAKAETLVLQAIEQAGIPLGAVSELMLRKAPFWPGSLHPRQYQRPDYLKHHPAWHVGLRFQKAIAGPLALGAGRHCGLGVFAHRERA